MTLLPRTEPTAGIQAIRYSVVIPVYGNEGSVEALLRRLEGLVPQLDGPMEAVFVVDGSPDNSLARLRELIPSATISTQLISHSRNFGSFAAIRTGIQAALGDYIGVMAADLQEPPELMVEFFRLLAADEADIAVGRREGRNDPAVSSFLSRVFW
ncbi:MAG TPA: glycosyltransferase, partial [Coriobacteriia bacterium]|nr:glycosyltransferase [Coriobacteriia bacterium]